MLETIEHLALRWRISSRPCLVPGKPMSITLVDLPPWSSTTLVDLDTHSSRVHWSCWFVCCTAWLWLVFGDTFVADTVLPSAQTMCSHSQQIAFSQTIGGMSAFMSTMSNPQGLTRPASFLPPHKQLHVGIHVISGPYRDAQDRLLWRDKTCPADT